MTTPSNCQVRRATIDDVVALRRLWQQTGLPSGDLEKRFREFQVVETAAGELLGAIGLQIEQHQGKIHSESYLSPASVDELRPRLWERLHAIARNHALTRLWIRHGTGMFWLEKGFEAAERAWLEKLPAALREPQTEEWLSLKLRDDVTSGGPVEQELELLRLAHLEHAGRVHQQARLLRALAALVLTALTVLVFGAAWFWLRHMKGR